MSDAPSQKLSPPPGEEWPTWKKIFPPMVHSLNIMLGAVLHFFVAPWPIDVVYYYRRPPGFVMALAALAVLLWCARYHKSKKSRFSSKQIPDELFTDGPYGYSRNPIYMTAITIHFGFGLMIGTWWILCTLLIAIAFMRLVIIPKEEAELHALFGAEYEAYCQKVRRWL